MRRRGLGIVVGLVLLGGLVVWAAVALTRPTPGVTRSNFGRLHTAMTIGEVEAVLGRPPDEKHRAWLTSYSWVGEEGTVYVIDHVLSIRGSFAVDGEVVAVLDTRRPFFAQVRRWLGW